MGRVNFGHKLEEQKTGIYEEVLINTHGHYHWDIFTLPLDETQMTELKEKGKWTTGDGTAASAHPENPAFFKFDFDLSLTDGVYSDTYLEFAGWGKGCVFVNGFNIGRFWEIGPQKRLYVPAPLLRAGTNEIIIFESEGKTNSSIEFFAEHKLF